MRNILASNHRSEDSSKRKCVGKRTKFVNKFIIGTFSLITNESTQLKLKEKIDSINKHLLKGKITEVPRANVRSHFTIDWEINNMTMKTLNLTSETLQNEISATDKNRNLLNKAENGTI